MNRETRVALVRCEGYERGAVGEAVGRGLDLLGGVKRFVRPGETILLKPNLLAPRGPERAVCTHPSVFAAVAERLSAAGAVLSYGDSPGFAGMEFVARRAGIAEVARELGVASADFSRGETVSFPDGRLIKRFTLARGALEAAGIVSLPKLKTHGLTRMTGAVKNLFGCIPGALKAEFHARLPNADLFAQMLVDLGRYLRPRLHVMDAIVAMEGNGPSSGEPRPMNVLLFSSDPVALDATACRLVGLDPRLVPTVRYGESFGLGRVEGIDLVGDPLESFVVAGFQANRKRRPTTEGPGRVSRLARRIVVPKPVIVAGRCTRCGTCVAICPVSPKAVDFDDPARTRPPVHHYERCIRCYCCQEMCPEGAIRIEVPLLGRLLHR